MNILFPVYKYTSPPHPLLLRVGSSSTFVRLFTQIFKKKHTKMADLKTKRKGNGITTKCATLVKKQRARIYILRRCATMLLCWYIHGDD
ncbi:hypothetical protein L1987_47442 [Smallanthus sonchifolius]|uniref:Uncharacterized protein n=1 Tax=Smallanthus sonchifolius TaxID=185202 RepID=A0ACB9G3M6_9ASTR|nr:hypothetical protein L1987_47442 [Smallanthus sonchifolius]